MAAKASITIARIESALAKLDRIEEMDTTLLKLRLQSELTMLLAKEDHADRRVAIPNHSADAHPNYAPLNHV